MSEEDKIWSRSLGDSGLPSSGRSSRGLEDCDSPVNLAEDKTADAINQHSVSDKCTDILSEHALGTLNTPQSELLPTEINDTSTKSNTDIRNSSLNLVSKGVEESSVLKKDLDESSNSLNRLTAYNHQLLNSLDSESVTKSDNLNGISCDEKVNHVVGGCTSSVSLQEFSDQIEDSLESHQDCENTLKLVLEKEDAFLGNSLTDCNAVESVHSSLPSSELSTTIVTSPWHSLTNEFEDVAIEEEKRVVDSTTAVVNENTSVVSDRLVPRKDQITLSAPVRVIESLDKVIESLEKIMEPLEVIAESELQLSAAGRLQSDKVTNVEMNLDCRYVLWHSQQNT